MASQPRQPRENPIAIIVFLALALAILLSFLKVEMVAFLFNSILVIIGLLSLCVSTWSKAVKMNTIYSTLFFVFYLAGIFLFVLSLLIERKIIKLTEKRSDTIKLFGLESFLIAGVSLVMMFITKDPFEDAALQVLTQTGPYGAVIGLGFYFWNKISVVEQKISTIYNDVETIKKAIIEGKLKITKKS